jgi:cell division protein FtsB
VRGVFRRWFHALTAVRADRWLFLGLLALFVYFAYHAVSGSRGLLAVLELRREIAATQTKLDGLVTERMELEHRVERLHPESLDLELLDERVRATLGLIHEDEVIVFTDGMGD